MFLWLPILLQSLVARVKSRNQTLFLQIGTGSIRLGLQSRQILNSKPQLLTPSYVHYAGLSTVEGT